MALRRSLSQRLGWAEAFTGLTSAMARLSAQLVIVGNEILTGKVVDSNTPWLLSRLRALGVTVRRVVVVPDVVAEIAREVRSASDEAEVVFTSGGVGPTHDDVTLEGVAEAFAVPLHLHPEVHALLSARWPEGVPAPALRMATLPLGAECVWDGQGRFPLVRVRNVWIFPGVPDIFRRKFDAVAHRFAGTPVTARSLTTRLSEVAIADCLSEATRLWPSVDIGSYPQHDDGEHHVLVTLEGVVPSDVHAAVTWVEAMLAGLPT